MRVSKALKELAGVEDVSVDLESGDVRISTGTPEPSRQEMEAAIRSAGYTVVE
jgi:copper chaperone CopZ